MTPNGKLDVDHLRSVGVTFLPSFLGGAVGVLARYDLPRLTYSAGIDAAQLELIIERVNRNLRVVYAGCGYYGCVPPGGNCSDGDHEYVVFADQEFYEDYRSGSLSRKA